MLFRSGPLVLHGLAVLEMDQVGHFFEGEVPLEGIEQLGQRLLALAADHVVRMLQEIGRASCRERV